MEDLVYVLKQIKYIQARGRIYRATMPGKQFGNDRIKWIENAHFII
jgi:hypothetical protein